MDFDAPERGEAYDRWYTTSLGQWVDRLEKQAVFELLPPLNGLRVLDAGCGTGSFSHNLAARGARVVGMDRSTSMLSRARAKVRERSQGIDWIQGDLSQLPFPAGSFAVAVAILSLDFTGSREAAVSELARVLRPGGVLILGVLNRRSLWTVKRVLRHWFRPSPWNEVKFLSGPDLIGLLQQTGEFHQIQGRRAVYCPPVDFPGLRQLAPYWERLGALFFPGLAAFLALSARKGAGP